MWWHFVQCQDSTVCKVSKNFFLPFFFYLKILLFSYLLHYWICANSTENSLTLSSWGDEKGVYYVLPFRNWERKKNVLQPDGCIPWFLQNAVYFLSQSPFSNPRWNAADLFRNPSSRSSDLDLYRNQFIGKTTWNCICIIFLGETIWICIEIQFIG